MEIEIRRITPADKDELAAFYSGLSRESMHARFMHIARGISGSAANTFCTPDHMHEEGFVAIATHELGQPFVGHVCLSLVDPSTVELGICVADDWQGWGIGRRLFKAAMEWARDHGFETIVASCLADNWRVLALLTSAPNAAQISTAANGVVEVTIPMRGPLPPAIPRPPFNDGRRRLSHRKPVRPLGGAWRRMQRPALVAGD